MQFIIERSGLLLAHCIKYRDPCPIPVVNIPKNKYMKGNRIPNAIFLNKIRKKDARVINNNNEIAAENIKLFS